MLKSTLILFSIRKSHTGFRLVRKSVALDDLERRNGRHCVLLIHSKR